MKSSVVNIGRSSRDMMFFILGCVLIVIGLVLAFDFLVRFIQFVGGAILIVVGLFFINYRRARFRMFKF